MDDATTLRVRLPVANSSLEQTEEYFYLEEHGRERRVRLQDYPDMYRVPGLYAYVLANLLQCDSPNVMVSLLEEELHHASASLADLTVLDLGAGTGMVGAELKRRGARAVVGIDIVEEALDAVEREHPAVYQDYYIADLCHLSPQTHAALHATGFNAMMCISAMGLHHIPAPAFSAGYNLVADGGWIAFNLREKTFWERNATGLPHLITQIAERGIFDVCVMRSYQHRRSVTGTPITYMALVGRKRASIPPDLC